MDVPETHRDRSYKNLTLANGIRCCLISDPTAEKAAVAVGVGSGQLQDKVPGIAHLTEHLLFMGSKTHPGENEYDEYMQKHGGHSNAYTDLELTCFYLDVVASHFAGALEILACALAEPLLLVDSIERELQAVDSEHAKNITQDHWRLHQLVRQLLGEAEKHPYASFGTGNKESLLANGDYSTLQQAVYNFYKQHYTASNMTVAALSNVSMEELQALVETSFARIETCTADSASFDPAPTITPPQQSLFVEWIPLREECRVLDMHWVLPFGSNYRTKPSRYWSHILGHEGPGTLLAVLRDRQWAHDLSADDVSTQCQNFGVFSLSVELTEEGCENVSSVLCMIWYFIEKVMATVPRWVFDELHVTGETGFTFLSKYDGAGTCSSLVGSMHKYEEQHYLSGAYKLFDYDAEAVSAIGQVLGNRSHVLIMLGSVDLQEDQVDKVDPWYGTRYRVAKSDHPLLHLERDAEYPELALPAQNDMLPTDFSLVSNDATVDSEEPPVCIMNTAACRLWHKTDTVYQTPKVNILALFRAPLVGPEDSVLAALFSETITEHCNDFAYAASMAGLHCGFQDSNRGMELTVSGYNHKAKVLLQRICDRIKEFSISTELLERMRRKLAQQYHMALSSPPYHHGGMVCDLLMDSSNKGLIQKRLAYLNNPKLVGCEELMGFSRRLFSVFELELLVHGNVSKEETIDLCSVITDTFKPEAPLRLGVPRGVQLPESSLYRLAGWNEHDENSCTVNIYQVGPLDMRANAILALLAKLMREPAFNILRTEEQLGYIVFSNVKTTADNVKSLMFLVQSDSHDPVHVDERIEAFLVVFRNKLLVNMTEENFQTNVQALCEGLLEKSKNLGEESSKHWSHIANRSYHFHRLREIAALVEKVTKLEVMQFFDKHILSKAPSRRKLSVQMFGNAHQDKLKALDGSEPHGDTVYIDNPETFICTNPLYEAFHSTRFAACCATP